MCPGNGFLKLASLQEQTYRYCTHCSFLHLKCNLFIQSFNKYLFIYLFIFNKYLLNLCYMQALLKVTEL